MLPSIPKCFPDRTWAQRIFNASLRRCQSCKTRLCEKCPFRDVIVGFTDPSYWCQRCPLFPTFCSGEKPEPNGEDLSH